MTVPITQVLDGARHVETRHDAGSLHEFAVWHGGHTVNFYQVKRDGFPIQVFPTHTVSVGDYETGEVSLDEVREAIDFYYNPGKEAEV